MKLISDYDPVVQQVNACVETQKENCTNCTNATLLEAVERLESIQRVIGELASTNPFLVGEFEKTKAVLEKLK